MVAHPAPERNRGLRRRPATASLWAEIQRSKQSLVYLGDLLDVVCAPASWGEQDRRLLEAIARLGCRSKLGKWFEPHLRQEKPDEDVHAALRSVCQVCDEPLTETVAITIERLPLTDAQGRPNSAGRGLLSLANSELGKGIAAVEVNDGKVAELLQLLFQEAPDRIRAVSAALILQRSSNGETRFRAAVCKVLLAKTGDAYVKPIATAWNATEDPYAKFLAGVVLDEIRPDLFREANRKAAKACLAGPPGRSRHDVVCDWLLRVNGENAIATIVGFVAESGGILWVVGVVCRAIELLGAKALPVVLAGLKRKDPRGKADLLACLIELKDRNQDDVVLNRLVEGLGGDEDLMKYIGLAGHWGSSGCRSRWRGFWQ